MTIKELNQRLSKLQKDISQNQKQAMQLAVLGTVADISERVFTHGIKADNSMIGDYAKSTVEIRTKKRRQTSFVDLKFTGNLENDFKTSTRWTGKAFVVGTKRKDNSNKMGWMEDKYGDIFDLTKKEYADYKKDVIDTVNKMIKQDLK